MEIKPTLTELLAAVHDEKSFLIFLHALTEDRVDGAKSWENGTIEDYLAAAAAWANDSNFGRTVIAKKFDDNCWNQFANILYAGKIYE
jgi:hypothetical protein